jgi:hypothetical protein
MSKLKTPHQKKKASLTRDRRSPRGKAEAATPKDLPRKKARLNRAFRHEVHTRLRVDGAPVEKIEPDDLDAAVGATRRKQIEKQPDLPLVEYIDRQREKRDLPPLRPRGTKKPR